MTPHPNSKQSNGSRRNRTAGDRLMRSALCRLSYRAATRFPPDHGELARDGFQSSRQIAISRAGRDDRKNLRHNNHLKSPRRESNSPPLDYRSSAPPSELRGPLSFSIADCRLSAVRLSLAPQEVPQSTIDNRQSLGGPRGSRTHYPSIKSRELILMSFRPPNSDK